jgi:hypothetical protein
MKSVPILSAFCALSAIIPATFAGDLSGKVTLKGTPPAEKEITPLSKDANCGKIRAQSPTTRHYVVGADNGLANVFVYVKKGLEGKTFPVPAEKPVIDQVGCLYEPYVSGAMVGQPVQIKNSDPFMHNVNFAMSKSGNTVFNFAQMTKGMVNEKTFTKPEVFVKLQCNVHNWMFAYVGVVDNPYFAVTDKDGNYTIKGLPAGKYTLAFAHLKSGETTQEVDVSAGAATANATLEAKAQ